MLSGLIDELEGNSLERLRWLVLREFGVLPGSREARRLRDGDVLYCAANMVLDRRGELGASVENPAFDFEKFREMGGGGA